MAIVALTESIQSWEHCSGAQLRVSKYSHHTPVSDCIAEWLSWGCVPADFHHMRDNLGTVTFLLSAYAFQNISSVHLFVLIPRSRTTCQEFWASLRHIFQMLAFWNFWTPFAANLYLMWELACPPITFLCEVYVLLILIDFFVC